MATSSASREFLACLGVALCVLLFSSVVQCKDPDQLQDFCVASIPTQPAATTPATPTTPTSPAYPSGADADTWEPANDASHIGVATVEFNETNVSTFPCKSPVSARDFAFSGLTNFTKNIGVLGSKVTFAFVTQFPAVNTLGISGARIDFAKNGVNPPHEHPRGTELFYILKGTVYAGLVDTNNNLYQTTLTEGDLFVFPVGLVHYQMEVGEGEASAFAAFDSQNPGRLDVVASLLGSNPPVQKEVIESAFGVDFHTYSSLLRAVESQA